MSFSCELSRASRSYFVWIASFFILWSQTAQNSYSFFVRMSSHTHFQKLHRHTTDSCLASAVIATCRFVWLSTAAHCQQLHSLTTDSWLASAVIATCRWLSTAANCLLLHCITIIGCPLSNVIHGPFSWLFLRLPSSRSTPRLQPR